MTDLVKIDDEVVTTDGFIRILKLSGRFDGLIEEILKDKLAVHAAKKAGIPVLDEEIQERADQFRRVQGLHRAQDAIAWLDSLGVTLDDLEQFIIDMLYQEKMMKEVCRDEAVEAYFKLHSPRFDSIEVSHIVMDSEGAAKEMLSVLADDPQSFAEMAAEHSLADTRERGGSVGKVMRGSLQPEIEAKVFNASPGDLVGPFHSGGEHHEIFRIDAANTARLDEETRTEIRRILREDWLAARAREHGIEIL